MWISSPKSSRFRRSSLSKQKKKRSPAVAKVHLKAQDTQTFLEASSLFCKHLRLGDTIRKSNHLIILSQFMMSGKLSSPPAIPPPRSATRSRRAKPTPPRLNAPNCSSGNIYAAPSIHADPELISTTVVGPSDKVDANWVSFGSSASAKVTEKKSVGDEGYPAFISTTDASFDRAAPSNSIDLFPVSRSEFVETTAFYEEGREEIEVSRFTIEDEPAGVSNAEDDASREDISPKSNLQSEESTASKAGHQSPPKAAEWDVATWMRAPIDAITDAVVAPIVPQRTAAGPENNKTVSQQGANGAVTHASKKLSSSASTLMISFPGPSRVVVSAQPGRTNSVTGSFVGDLAEERRDMSSAAERRRSRAQNFAVSNNLEAMRALDTGASVTPNRGRSVATDRGDRGRSRSHTRSQNTTIRLSANGGVSSNRSVSSTTSPMTSMNNVSGMSSGRTPSLSDGVSSPLLRSSAARTNSGNKPMAGTRSVHRRRASERLPSPSSSTVSGMSLRQRDAWGRDVDNMSVGSEPIRRAQRRSNSVSSRSSRISAENLRRLDSTNGSRNARSGTPSVAGSDYTTQTSKSSIRERLFGDSVSNEARRSYLPSRIHGKFSSAVSTTSAGSAPAMPEAFHTRTLLTASVYHNHATGLWIATINTNQNQGATNRRNAGKHLKAFSFLTQREARESAYSNAPPKMISFEDSPRCFICTGKFAVFRRASHCRNCGVCVCSNCSVSWPSKTVPETYNLKRENNIKVCKSCNFLTLAFRRSLLDGQYDEAIALYNTGNINLRCPFVNIKGREVMFPIHCAAQGGNLKLLRWLVDVHYCPISLVRTGNKKIDGCENQPIVTSKGRSILNIAMSAQKVEMIRYLVKEKNLSVYEITDLKITQDALQAVLSHVPVGQALNAKFPNLVVDPINMHVTDNIEMLQVDDETDRLSVLSDDDLNTTTEFKDESMINDECILCYDNSIDCVMTPCGHQVCCLQCSANLDTCPVCNSKGTFIRIFKP